jgi:hypothetical protein
VANIPANAAATNQMTERLGVLVRRKMSVMGALRFNAYKAKAYEKRQRLNVSGITPRQFSPMA